VGIGASLFLIALGAIKKFAVTADPRGLSLGTVGVILMAVGALGLVLTVIIWDRGHGPGWTPAGERGDVIEERRVYGRRRPPY